ncbi:phenylalanine 4-monooxygenase [Streptomyces sp. NPDC094468]|uniref:phenylalanine 4-monooxygenase n=1 Tax=Streptomyces sp. NPDC094468 TaxID=3366066 RepID=UPI0038024EAB
MQGPHDHITDAAYEARRSEIAAKTAGLTPEDPIPVIEYTDWEHEVWRTVCVHLADRHRKDASVEFLESAEQLAIPLDHVPQLRDVSGRLESVTGFRFQAAPTLVPLREFCGGLASSVFHSTQYLRHPRSPFYTENPDLLHDLVGHGTVLASDRFANLYRLAGTAAARVQSDEALQFIGKVFWFTLECGVIRERGERKAYGATLVSSYGELDHFRSADFRPLDIESLTEVEYDISTYQRILFEAESMNQVEDTVGSFWDTCDDDTIASLLSETSRQVRVAH